jgi:hypothetical protein
MQAKLFRMIGFDLSKMPRRYTRDVTDFPAAPPPPRSDSDKFLLGCNNEGAVQTAQKAQQAPENHFILALRGVA